MPAAKLKASIAYTSNEAAKPKKQAKYELSTLEVSAIEAGGTFMELRSGKRKYPPQPPAVGGSTNRDPRDGMQGFRELRAPDSTFIFEI